MFCRGLISSSGRPRLGPSSSAHWQLTASSPAEGPAAQGLTFITSLCFTFPFSRTQGLFHPFLPWRRRLGERRRYLSCLRPALCRRRAYPPGMPTPSLSLCCARRSTPNPNKTICIRIWIQLQYITNFDFVCQNYRVFYAGSAPEQYVLGLRASRSYMEKQPYHIFIF